MVEGEKDVDALVALGLAATTCPWGDQLRAGRSRGLQDRLRLEEEIQIFGLRTDARIVQRADEAINLMILESLSELSPTIEQLVHTIRYAERL